MKTGIRLSLLLPLAAFALTTAARANLVANGSFEGSTLFDPDTFNYLPANWDFTAAADGFGLLDVGGDTSDPNGQDFFIPAEDGSEFAVFGAFGSDPDAISQTLATIAGTQYTFSFYVDTELTSGLFDLSASWDGTDLLDLSTPQSGGWSQYSFTENGTGSDTISFVGIDPPGYALLDTVDVEAVQAPDGGLGAPLAAVVLLGLCMAARPLRSTPRVCLIAR
jgi:hypothetical protein